MCFIDDHQVPHCAFEKLEHLLLLGEVDGGQAVRDVVEGVGPEHERALHFLKVTGAADGIEAKAEALAHLSLPLLEERPRRGHDEDTMGPAPRDELGHHQAGFHRLAEADTVGQEQTRPAHPQRPHDGYELVRRDIEATRLDRQQGRRSEGLLEQEGVVVEPPLAEPTRAGGIEVDRNGQDGLERMQQVDLHALEVALQAPQTQPALLAGSLGVHDLPRQAAGLDLGAGEERDHRSRLPIGGVGAANSSAPPVRPRAFAPNSQGSRSGVGRPRRKSAAPTHSSRQVTPYGQAVCPAPSLVARARGARTRSSRGAAGLGFASRTGAPGVGQTR